MPREEPPILAHLAYDAYCTMLRRYKDTDPALLAAWDDLKPKERAAWQYVVDTIERQVLALVTR